MNSAKRGRNIGCSITTIILVLSIIGKFISAYQKSQIQSEHPNPIVYTPHTTFTEPASISDNYCPKATLDAFVSASGPLLSMSDKLIQESSAETASLVVQEHAKIVENFESLEVPPCLKAVRDETLLALNSRQKAAEYAAAGDWSNVEKAWNEANSHFDRASKLLDEAEACAKGIDPCP